MDRLANLLESVERFIPEYGRTVENVSKGSIGWHIEHSLLTVERIIDAVRLSDAGTYKRAFKPNHIVVLYLGFIPRGKAQAPKVVRPKSEMNAEELQAHLTNVKEKLTEINTISPKQYFLHPFLGNLNKKQTVRFLEVHTNHHLKIIKDIVTAK